MSVTANAPTRNEKTMSTDRAAGELVKASDRTPSVITTPDEYRQAVKRWQDANYHVLTPIANFNGLAAQHGIIAAVVQVNPDPTSGEVYQDKLFCKENEVAIAKIGLSKIMQAGGISVTTQRTDPRTIQNYWEMKATARWRGLDGSIQEAEATHEYDLRDGSPRVRNFTANQILAARVHGLRGCEARAINAAIRQFGIKQKYTKQELAKPFVIVRVMFQPDMGDAETRRIVTEHALRGTTALYPHAPAPLPAIEGETIGDVDARPVGSSSTVASTPASSTPPQTSQPDGLFVTDVTSKSGKTNGRDWTVFTVTFSDGRDGGTFSDSIANDAKEAKAKRLPVKIALEDTDRGPKLVSLSIVTEDEPPLPLESEGTANTNTPNPSDL